MRKLVDLVLCLSLTVLVLGGCGGSSGGGPSCTSKNPLNVAGTYDVSFTAIDNSDCPSAVTTELGNSLSGVDFTANLTQNGSGVTLGTAVGCVDDQGNIEISLQPQSGSLGGCTDSVSGTATANLATTPSTLQEPVLVAVSSGCALGFSSCTLVVDFTITETGSAELAPGTGGDPLTATQDATDAVVNTH